MTGFTAMTADLTVKWMREAVADAQLTTADPDDAYGERVVPFELRQWLARLRLLEGVPFAYLVADSELLPQESIRFFYLDRAWTDSLVEGALSVGTVNSSDRAELEKVYDVVRSEVDEEERRVRLPGGEDVVQAPAGTITGFLLRSSAVSGWPGLHVRAYATEPATRDDEIIPESDPRRLKVLRMERLAPAVLLVLFDGLPAVVHIEEPRQGVQFGVRLDASAANTFAAWVPGRDALTSEDVEVPPGSGNKVRVDIPFRPGSPGVVNLHQLVAQFVAKKAQLHVGDDLDSAELALQMIRYPYRQVFGDTTLGGTPVDFAHLFRPQLGFSVADLVATFTAEA
ncbi:MAG TPA: hypothetical protein VF391_13215 [Dermatophilaceae bacterium]|jgi:hypothetical protein